ncbi:hypothetical protein ZIOFF_007246 [Zingiber officinale]|uniref:Guanine nucleotide-binding protein subunit beta-like protein A n=1 Tax=Zingiber officinale TaxID=94328 RepID=A0A8J5I1I0_ZINOF|nr:hypothetical protein ZIOFF_007246 [Zingiber officinale]
MASTLVLRCTMRGHSDAVTAIAAPIDNSDMIVSSSRDKSLLVWNLTKDSPASGVDGSGEGYYGVPRRRLTGHSHFVQDVALSSDGQFALSGSWYGDLRLWYLSTGATTRRFSGHAKDVISVAFSVDNRFSGHATLEYTRPNALLPAIVSGSWDRTVKVWNMTNCKLRCTLAGHTGYVNTVAVSPDGSLCASGGKDGFTLLWDLGEGKRLYALDAGAIIHALCFSPNRYWLCAATRESVKIWDLESKSVVQDLKPETTATNNQVLYCTSLTWSADGSTLFTGYTDGAIRVWEIRY